MPRSRTRKSRKSPGGGGLTSDERSSPAQRRRVKAITAGTIAIIAVAISAYWWISAKAGREFLALAVEGQASLANVTNERSLGGGHLAPGQTRTYQSRFPTSGSHHRVPTDPGFYQDRQPAINLVHALEHGHIVIYYDKPEPDVLMTLQHWSKLYPGHWDGVVATPMSGLGPKIVLTAWAKRVDLAQFDKPAAAAFIDAFRGRGPENPVR